MAENPQPTPQQPAEPAAQPSTPETAQPQPAAPVQQATASATPAPQPATPTQQPAASQPATTPAATATQESIALPETSNNRQTQQTEVTSEGAAVPESYFLLYPANEDVVTGDSRSLPPLGARLVFIVGLVLLAVGIGLIVYTVSLWSGIGAFTRAGAPAPQGAIPVASAWTVGAFLYNVFVLGLFLSGLQVTMKRRGLEKRGQLVWGEVVSASGRRNRSGTLAITVEYQFQRP
ncbi:MAG: hypothetical protein AAF787_24675, partial [Chloroflexota bacterium]